MIRRTLLIATIALLPASQTLAQAPAKAPTPAKQMAEDVEILRRVLQKKAMETPQPAVAGKACTACHAKSNTQDGHQVLRWMLSGDSSKPHSEMNYYFPDSTVRSLAFSPDGQTLLATTHGQPAAGFAAHVEGTYLKGQGVILTMTLPATGKDPRTESGKAGPKPLSDWERARLEVRGEKTAPPPAAADRVEPALVDVILRVLADNGKHLAQLPGDENVTVAVTFRAPSTVTDLLAPIASSRNAPGFLRDLSDQEFIRRVYLDVLGRPPSAEENNQASKDTSAKGRDKVIEELLAKSWQDHTINNAMRFLQERTATSEHELLGDLHMKQNRYQEAINAYEKAAAQKPKPAELAEIYRKLAQAHLATQNVARAQQLLEQIKKLSDATKATAPKPESSAQPPLPAKLTITAPKKLLDLIGAEKITWEEFKKAATIEYQTFE